MQILIRKIVLLSVVLLIQIVCYAENKIVDDYSAYDDEYMEYLETDNKFKIKDSIESFNRNLYKVNRSFDAIIGIPIIKTYKYAIPSAIKLMLKSSINNFQEPSNAINFLIDGNLEMAFNSFWRLFINTTAGVFGIFDVATELGLPAKNKTFDEILYKFAKDDIYLYAPILGPSTIIGFIGLLFDFIVNPLSYFIPGYVYRSAFLLYIIQMKSDIFSFYENTEKHSIDPYISWRSYYTQYRINKVFVN
ncbi:phospholipid-binding lipoprotein MlaA [Candidatus Xenohaliotis californiensis]|uniref:Phospholipid-binding lipoprotein MlaA n=1 Tax=Candidatus Xenohaliotis californiensis TaxID=84677 RepID=A0ABP0EW85_9RICK|nr:phospholipid-binding lipoprotein MlaA [Candidatus Xenohaliotis californiensis]